MITQKEKEIFQDGLDYVFSKGDYSKLSYEQATDLFKKRNKAWRKSLLVVSMNKCKGFWSKLLKNKN